MNETKDSEGLKKKVESSSMTSLPFVLLIAFCCI